MTDYIYCPFCKRKNSITNIHCAHCGTSLVSSSSTQVHTTSGIAHLPSTSGLIEETPCHKHLELHTPGTLLLFPLEEKEPIIIQKSDSIILGRDPETLLGKLLQKGSYSGLSLGVSRYHAKIVYQQGIYEIEDLNSTNGTWINRQRIAAGERYQLHSEDRIWLGPVRLSVCYKEKATTDSLTILLQPQNSLNKPIKLLSVAFLAQDVAPYLQAIASVQAEFNFEQSDVPVPFVQELLEEDGQLRVTLEGVNPTLHLLAEYLLPWRQKYGALAPQDAYDPAQTAVAQQAVQQLASQIAQLIHPSVGAETQLAAEERLLPTLSVLAFSRLELFLATAVS
jgi:hypothetical protein